MLIWEVKMPKGGVDGVNEWLFIEVFYDYNQSKLYMWNDPQAAPIDTLDFNAPLFPNDETVIFIHAIQKSRPDQWL